MATQAQIQANRKNAKKSTGPKTPDGKSTVAQNALKHGLTALKPLIPGEDPEQFAIFNESMLADLTPHGPLETVIANRIITLTWQLNRAPRIQAAAFNFMMKDLFSSPKDPEERIGKTIATDFEHNHVLEKLQNYEQRIESNLYKTIAQLEKFQKNRKTQENNQLQSTNHQPQTTNSIPQNKPNLYAHGVPCPDQPANQEPPTTNSFEKTPVASKQREDGNPIYPAPKPKKQPSTTPKQPHTLSNAVKTAKFKTPNHKILET